jgi:hypothetical protein
MESEAVAKLREGSASVPSVKADERVLESRSYYAGREPLTAL